jgi:hypothetical protein
MGLDTNPSARVKRGSKSYIRHRRKNPSIVESRFCNVDTECGNRAQSVGKLIESRESELSSVVTSLGNLTFDCIISSEHSACKLHVTVLDSGADPARAYGLIAAEDRVKGDHAILEIIAEKQGSSRAVLSECKIESADNADSTAFLHKDLGDEIACIKTAELGKSRNKEGRNTSCGKESLAFLGIAENLDVASGSKASGRNVKAEYGGLCAYFIRKRDRRVYYRAVTEMKTVKAAESENFSAFAMGSLVLK